MKLSELSEDELYRLAGRRVKMIKPFAGVIEQPYPIGTIFTILKYEPTYHPSYPIWVKETDDYLFELSDLELLNERVYNTGGNV